MKVKLDYSTILVAGSRKFTSPDTDVLKSMSAALHAIIPEDDILVFHGGGPGAEFFAGEILAGMGIHCGVIRRLDDEYGKDAPVLQRRFLAAQAEAAILFWSGLDSETKLMAQILAELAIEFRLCIWDPADNKFKLRDPMEILE